MGNTVCFCCGTPKENGQKKMKGHMHFLFFVLRTGCFLKKLRRDSYWRRKHSHKITVVGTLQSPLGLRGELLTTSATQAHHNLFKVCHDCQTRTGPSGWRHISKFLYININPFLSACLWCFLNCTAFFKKVNLKLFCWSVSSQCNKNTVSLY